MNGFFAFVWSVFGPIFRFFHPVKIEGLEHLPPHGALLCPNHSSNWDPVLITVCLPRDYNLRIMAKDSLFRIPVVSWVVRKLGAFPVSRGNSDIKAIKTAISVIKNGGNLMIFPEGKRVKQGEQVQAKGGVAVIGIRTGAILVPVFMERKQPLFRPMRLIIGQPYTPTYTGRHGTAEEVQAIADEVLRQAYALGKGQKEA